MSQLGDSCLTAIRTAAVCTCSCPCAFKLSWQEQDLRDKRDKPGSVIGCCNCPMIISLSDSPNNKRSLLTHQYCGLASIRNSNHHSLRSLQPTCQAQSNRGLRRSARCSQAQPSRLVDGRYDARKYLLAMPSFFLDRFPCLLYKKIFLSPASAGRQQPVRYHFDNMIYYQRKVFV